MGVFIINIQSGLVLGAKGKNELKLLKRIDDVGTVDSLKQQWNLKASSDGSYTICNCYFGTCIAVSDLSCLKGKIQLSDQNFDDKRQHWCITTNNSICLKSSTRQVLDIGSGKCIDGADIIIFPHHGKFNQLFVISHIPSLYKSCSC